MTDRGVLYMVWGRDEKIERALERSRKSINAIHPELPNEVVRLNATDPIKALLEKARMFERWIVLILASEKAHEFGIACCICECPWARRYGGVRGGIIEYNTGVLFFTEKAKPVFERWASLAPQIDSSIVFFGAQ